MDRFMRSRDQTITALQEHIKHAKSLMKARSIVDTSTPHSFTPHSTQKRGKSAYLSKDRDIQISVENIRLCRKIKDEMSRRRFLLHKKTKRSLNVKAREHERERITNENQRIFKALNQTQSCISSNHLEKFNKENKRRRSILVNRNINEFIWTKFNNKRVCMHSKMK